MNRDLNLLYLILRNYRWLFGTDGVKYRVRKTSPSLQLSEAVRELLLSCDMT